MPSSPEPGGGIAPCIPMVAALPSARWPFAIVRLSPVGEDATSPSGRGPSPAMAKASSMSSGREAAPSNPSAQGPSLASNVSGSDKPIEGVEAPGERCTKPKARARCSPSCYPPSTVAVDLRSPSSMARQARARMERMDGACRGCG